MSYGEILLMVVAFTWAGFFITAAFGARKLDKPALFFSLLACFCVAFSFGLDLAGV